ncbi:MAG: D-alanine--D-alanine ligase [Mariprofundaceae bacterium]
MNTMTNKRVGVLMGGTSNEREISLRSGNAVFESLLRSGIDAVAIDLTDDWSTQIQHANIDIAFIALHGTLGEDGCVQGLLEILRVPYTGSGVTASALCMHKPLCKTVLEAAGLKTPINIAIEDNGPIRYPVFIKPKTEGSSVGLHQLDSVEAWQALDDVENVSEWMAEMPVKGVEIAISVLNGEALPAAEVAPKSGVYDYASKYTAGATEYFCPARIPAETYRRCLEVAEEAVKVTECRGAPRVDMIVADGGEPVILEVNTIPGMTDTSLLPKSAATAGIDFDALCLQILTGAGLDAEVTQ